MTFLQILPALITLVLVAISGLIALNKQQVRFDGELSLLRQTLSSEKERVLAEIIAQKIVNDYFVKKIDHSEEVTSKLREELSFRWAILQKMEANIEFIKEALKELKDK